MYGVSNLDGEIYFNGGGPNTVGDPSSGEVGPDSIMWICSQTKLIASVSSSSSHLISQLPELIRRSFFQLAALKLVEQGKVNFDTPVGDYLPEFRNPIIVDNTESQDTSFKPAERIVTLKHLLNFTSGLFYQRISNSLGLNTTYISKDIHRSDDPASEFFRVLTVRSFFLASFEFMLKSFYQGDLPGLPLKFEPGTDCNSLSSSSLD